MPFDLPTTDGTDPTTPVAASLWASALESISPILDRVARLVRASTGARVGLVTLVHGDELRVIGSAADADWPVESGLIVPSSASLCVDVTRAGDRMFVSNAETDVRFAGHPAVAAGLAAYAGVPLMVGGECIGAVCAVDDLPHVWTEHDQVILADLQVMASHELELLRASEEQTRLVEALCASQDELRRVADELARLAASDDLTGLANRRAFTARLEDETRRALRHARPLSVVLFDIDRFKAVNDTFGHPAGDRVLESFARRIQSLARGEEMLARIGGEEFAWILPETDGDGALAAAERARLAIAAEPFDEVGAVTISAGLCELGDVPTPDDLVRAADAALYRAKRSGRNRSVRHGADPLDQLSGASGRFRASPRPSAAPTSGSSTAPSSP